MKKVLSIIIVFLLLTTLGVIPIQAQTNAEQEKLNSYLYYYRCFLTSFYTKPEEMDLFELFYSGATINDTNVSQEEKDTLSNLYCEGQPIRVGVTKVKKQDAVNLLKEKTNLTEEKIIQKLNETEYLYYLEDYDAYYTIHGDTNISDVQVISYTIENDNIYKVTYSGGWAVETNNYKYGCVTLEKNGDNYKFVANTGFILIEEQKINIELVDISLPTYESDFKDELGNEGVIPINVKATGNIEYISVIVKEMNNPENVYGPVKLLADSFADFSNLNTTFYGPAEEEKIYVITDVFLCGDENTKIVQYTTDSALVDNINTRKLEQNLTYKIKPSVIIVGDNNGNSGNNDVPASQTQGNGFDNTVANKELPKTGEKTIIVVFAIIIIISLAITSSIIIKKYRK